MQFDKNGRPVLRINEQQDFHDFITLSYSLAHQITDKAKPLYEGGYTLRQIAKRLGMSKTSIRKSLLMAGVDLRPSNRYLKKKTRPPGAPHVGAPPYGYCVIKGQLVEVPKEMEIVQIILELWRDGMPFYGIAKELNRRGLKPRVAKQWEHTSIISIVKRHCAKNE